MTITDTYTPGDLDQLEDEPSNRRSSRKLVAAGLAAAAAVGVGAGLYFMLGQNAAVDDSQFRLAPTVTSPSAAAPSTKPVVPAAVSIGKRDPFKALKPGSAPAPVVGSDTSSTATTAGAGSAGAPIAAPTSAPVSSVTLSVTSINLVTQTAVVDIDGKKYATGVGKSFGDRFTMYSVFNAQCVGIMHGSVNTPVCLSAPATVDL
jgi:hypothetical protein